MIDPQSFRSSMPLEPANTGPRGDDRNRTGERFRSSQSNSQVERVRGLLADIESLAYGLRFGLANTTEAVEVDRFDAALARLRAAKPRIEDLMGSGDPLDRLGPTSVQYPYPELA
jgi:hypothetical protein